MIELTGSKSEVIYKPLPADDPIRRCPDIGLARETLGWEPKIRFEQGLMQTIAYFQDLLNRPGELGAPH